MRVGVLGAGSWGTALAIEFARSGHEVLLWGRDPEVAATHRRRTAVTRGRLEGFSIPPSVRGSSNLEEAFAFAETLLVSVPCASLRPLLDRAPASDGAARRLVSTVQGHRARDAQAHDRDHARALSGARRSRRSPGRRSRRASRGATRPRPSSHRRMRPAPRSSSRRSRARPSGSTAPTTSSAWSSPERSEERRGDRRGNRRGAGLRAEHAGGPRDARASPRSPASCAPAADRSARSTGSPASATSC